MSTVSENLERRFQSFINHDEPRVFFKGLFEYIRYVHSQPMIEAVVVSKIGERDAKNDEILNIEKKAVAEMRAAKEKLLAIVDKTGVDTNSFQRFRVWASSENIIEELDAFEKGTYSKSGWHSDNLGSYLFDIAANLRAIGHEAELGEFMVSPEEYDRYWQSIDGPGHYTIFGDEQNAFIFSQTLPQRYQVMALIEKERDLKLWGDFEALLRFEHAYDAISKNGNFSTILRDEDIHTLLDAEEKKAIALMGEDLQIIIGDGKDTYRHKYSHAPDRIEYLHVKTFRAHVQRVHVSLMEASDGESDAHETRNESERPPVQKEPSSADKKRLFILEKLKDEWDLVPKQSTGPTMIQEAVVVYKQRGGEANISSKRFYAWMRECGIDYYQLRDILTTFEQEGLIMSFETMDESR